MASPLSLGQVPDISQGNLKEASCSHLCCRENSYPEWSRYAGGVWLNEGEVGVSRSKGKVAWLSFLGRILPKGTVSSLVGTVTSGVDSNWKGMQKPRRVVVRTQ